MGATSLITCGGGLHFLSLPCNNSEDEMPNWDADDMRVARMNRANNFGYQARKDAARSNQGPYDSEDTPGGQVVSPLLKDTARRARATVDAEIEKGSYGKAFK